MNLFYWWMAKSMYICEFNIERYKNPSLQTKNDCSDAFHTILMIFHIHFLSRNSRSSAILVGRLVCGLVCLWLLSSSLSNFSSTLQKWYFTRFIERSTIVNVPLLRVKKVCEWWTQIKHWKQREKQSYKDMIAVCSVVIMTDSFNDWLIWDWMEANLFHARRFKKFNSMDWDLKHIQFQLKFISFLAYVCTLDKQLY